MSLIKTADYDSSILSMKWPKVVPIHAYYKIQLRIDEIMTLDALTFSVYFDS